MKNRWIGSLLLAAVVGCSSSSSGSGTVIIVIPPRWQSLFRTPTTVHLRAAIFTNPSQGIVAGDSTGIFRTNNGDFATPTWTQQEHEPFNLGGNIVAIDGIGGVLHAVGTDPAGNARYWATFNSINWLTPAVLGGVNFTDVSVPTQNDAYYLRQNGEILYNDGSSLTPVAPGVPGTPGGNWFALKVFEIGGQVAGLAYVGGLDGGGNATIYVFDAALPGWTQATLPGGATQAVTDFSFLAGATGFAISGGMVLRTLNGTAWGDATGTLPGGLALNAIHFPIIPGGGPNLQFGCVVGDNATIYVTQDGDQPAPTWTAGTINGLTVPGVNLNDVWFADLMTGYAVGDDGVVLRTTDAGVTWDDISNGGIVQSLVGNPWPHFNDVEFSRDGTIGLAVGEVFNAQASVWRSLDSGATWELFNLGIPADANLLGVSIPETGSGNVAYICGVTGGGNGIVMMTPDLQGPPPAGWVLPAPAAPNTTFNAIEFPGSDDVGIVVGDQAAGTHVYKVNRAPFGLTAATLPPTAADYKAIGYQPGGLLIFIAGSNSNVEFSADFGTTWTADTTAPPVPVTTLNAVAAPVTNELFLGAPDGNVYLRLMGIWGTTTPPTTSAPIPPVLDLSFPVNGIQGWCVKDDNLDPDDGIFYTTDGITWNVSPDHTSEAVRAIWMSPLLFGLGYAAGENGTLLRTTVGGQ